MEPESSLPFSHTAGHWSLSRVSHQSRPHPHFTWVFEIHSNIPPLKATSSKRSVSLGFSHRISACVIRAQQYRISGTQPWMLSFCTLLLLFWSRRLFRRPIPFNPLTPNNLYSGRTAPLTSNRCILYIYSTNIGTEYFKHGIYSVFFSSKCSLFHNSNVFGSCIIHIYSGVLKLKKK